MAGYDVHTIVGSQNADNFFVQWVNNINPGRLSSTELTATHPTASQRATAVRSRLQQVADKSDLFNLGLWFYQAGDFNHAQQAFDSFKQYYPGREVYHNLAASYHQLALQYYQPTIQELKQVPFYLTISIDPLNRASRLAYRSKPDAAQLFEEYIQAAIDNYQKAIALDPEYLLAYTNLASAYLILKQPYKAIAVLQDAEKLNPSDPILLNNMGVAFYQANDPAKATNYLRRGLRNQPIYTPALFNLGVIATREQDNESANQYWDDYLKLDSQSAWAQRLRNYLGATVNSTQAAVTNYPREKLAGVEVGTYHEEIPAQWHQIYKKIFKLGTTPHQLADFKNGIITVSEANEVRLLIAKSDFDGNSARGIRIGQHSEDVIKAYGPADRIDITAQGKNLAYHAAGISFHVQNDKVTSWILYFD